MNDLLERAALPYGQETREKARQFFVSNFERLYHDQYNASIDMVFLPTTYGSIQTRLVCLPHGHFSTQGRQAWTQSSDGHICFS
jgi:hypothetical protein